VRLFGVIPLPSFRKIFKSTVGRIILITLGILCLAAAIWFGFPMTGVGFLSTVWLRATLIGVLVFIILLVQILKWRKRRRAARELEDSLMDSAPVGDGEELSKRMNEALAKLKKTGGKTYLYDLPWYIIIGPPGAGKTTALRNSGIEFPGTDAEAVEGFGGTKNCDWWFAEDAVLIDTAGRYTTQDSDAAADEASWTAFLDQLKRGRPNQPINGVILAFSVEHMMTESPEQLAEHATTVRARLAEVHETLKIDFPVYVLFTKADLISGFREYFQSFSQSRRKAVWGTTFQTKDRSEQTFQHVTEEFDALVSRLSDEIIDRMNEEPDGVSRISIFGLPGQMAMMRENIAEFMRRVFEPTRYKSNALLRGFYFTSGTQEGTPIDQVLGAMSQNESDAQAFAPAFMSGKGKSYFLHDLLTKVIFAERDWVSHDRAAVRRRAILRSVMMSVIVLATVGAMGVFGYSYWRNASLIQSAANDASAYFSDAQRELQRTVIDDPDPSLVMPHLEDLRLMTAGYGDPRETDRWEKFGLSQQKPLNGAAERAYSDALERMLRPRMILQLENDIPQMIADDNTSGVYRALKVYILLGGQQDGQSDDEAIQSYFSDVWRAQFNSIGQADERDELEAHLEAMLELDDDRTPTIPIDQAIVDNARDAIVTLPLAEQAYASIKDRMTGSGIPDFNLVERVDGRVEGVFQTVDGSDIAEVGVPALYTFEGYWGFFLEELTNARQRLRDDQWVLGEDAERVGYETQLSGLERELHRVYRLEFKQAWDEMLAQIEMAPLSADTPDYELLAATSSTVASPLLELVEAVEEETRLGRLYEQIGDLSPEDLAGGGFSDAMGDTVMRRMYTNSDVFSRVVLDTVQDGSKSQERAGANAAEENTQRRQVERITEDFEDWHVLLGRGDGPRPIDTVLETLGKIRENRRAAARSPTPADEQFLQDLLSELTVNNTSLPEPMARLLNEIEGEFRSVATDQSIADLNIALNNEVSQFCREQIATAYPFGNGRHLSPRVFGQFFGPSGMMDSFYTTYLQPHVVRTSDGLQPAPNSPIGERLNPDALRQFERAEQIRLAFFASGSPEPEVNMSVTHVSSSPSVELAILQLNGESIRTLPDGSPAALSWPGQASGVSIELYPQPDGRSSRKAFESGRWAIVDFLRSGRARPSGTQVDVTHEIGGRTITYRIEFDSTTVPFLMPELADFGCPTTLE